MGRMRFGVHKPLEEIADAIIAESLRGVTSQSAKSDILTPWKERDRRSREVYTGVGTPDPSIRQGMFHRRVNPSLPHLNSRDGVSSALARRTTRSQGPSVASLADFVAQHIEGQGRP